MFDGADFPGRLDDLSPWLDMRTRSDDEVLAHLDAQEHRRFVKTHTPLDGVPEWNDATFVAVARDPRDVFVSWEHHMANIDTKQFATVIGESGGLDALVEFHRDPLPTVEERLDLWLVNDEPNVSMSLAHVLGHANNAWERRQSPNVQLFHFHDMSTDRVSTMTRLAAAVGLETTCEHIEALADEASFDKMRSRADDLAPNTKRIFTDPALFFRSGDGGDWRSLMTPERESIYWRRIDQLTTPEVSDWLHRS